jgi:hypothetical protein
LIAAAVAVFLVSFFYKPEQPPQEKITSTGVVEQVHGGEGGSAQYTVRFTGARNRSFVAKTGFYRGETHKYEDGKLVHIRYWFDPKGRPGVEILDGELVEMPEKARNARWCQLLSLALLALGILLLVR